MGAYDDLVTEGNNEKLIEAIDYLAEERYGWRTNGVSGDRLAEIAKEKDVIIATARDALAKEAAEIGSKSMIERAANTKTYQSSSAIDLSGTMRGDGTMGYSFTSGVGALTTTHHRSGRNVNTTSIALTDGTTEESAEVARIIQELQTFLGAIENDSHGHLMSMPLIITDGMESRSSISGLSDTAAIALYRLQLHRTGEFGEWAKRVGPELARAGELEFLEKEVRAISSWTPARIEKEAAKARSNFGRPAGSTIADDALGVEASRFADQETLRRGKPSLGSITPRSTSHAQQAKAEREQRDTNGIKLV